MRRAPSSGRRSKMPPFAPMRSKVPRPALLLGFAGLIPPVFLTGVALFEVGLFAPSTPGFVRTYAAIILSFLGGSWWAFAAREERPSWLLLGIAVLPALAGWTAIFWFKPPEAMFGLAVLLVAALAVGGGAAGGRAG